MDGLTMRRLANELNSALTGAKIEKIHQPGERDLVISLRSPGMGSRRLLISAHKQFARMHFLAHEKPDNPPEPPMFCMLLRKHLEGGRIVGVAQQGWDRVIELHVESIDELGDVRVYSLVCEMMGRHSNIILCRNHDDGTKGVIDAIVRVTEAMSRHREVLPGCPYVPPPAQPKQAIQSLTKGAFAAVDAAHWLSRANVMLVVERLAGVGPVSAREILFRASRMRAMDAGEAVFHCAEALVTCVEQASERPSVAIDEMGRAVECAPFLLAHRDRYADCPDMSEAIRRRFADTGEILYHSRLQDELVRVVADQIDKLRGKRVKLEASLADSADEERYRVQAELLTAFAYQVPKGASRVELPNYYREGEVLSIELDPALDAIANAQRYFKLATKRKRAQSAVAAQMAETERDLAYLEAVMQSLADTSLDNLEQVRRELISQGFLTPKMQRRKPGSKRGRETSRDPEAKPAAYLSEDGFVMRVGRNNLQNDRLTLRTSAKHDLWLHVKGEPGSHVVIDRGQAESIPESTIEEAALLAAYFSRARDSATVPVDITEVRNVWKPNGARPGFVLYDQQRTLFVTPDRTEVESILQRRADTNHN
ncbi:fibronectin-binding protein [Alicyclobacillus tengchongensis]|nr:fibronectin-binding protein [Alicyclobacillus tengchongensis]